MCKFHKKGFCQLGASIFSVFKLPCFLPFGVTHILAVVLCLSARLGEAVSAVPMNPLLVSPLLVNKLLILTIMSHTHSAATSSSNQTSNFQVIFNNALKTYERRTKKDLLAHPLALQLQTCDSHSSILTVLQRQVQELNQSQSSDERLTKWLDPTVKVLYTFSETLGESISLVCPVVSESSRFAFSYLLYRYSRPRKRSFPE